VANVAQRLFVVERSKDTLRTSDAVADRSSVLCGSRSWLDGMSRVRTVDAGLSDGPFFVVRRLLLGECRVDTAALEELIVRPYRDDAARFDYHDTAAAGCGRDAMRDDDDRARLRVALQR
jgi:hypothetical protein